MAVTVRLFAALRDAAGAATVDAEPGPLPDVVNRLCDRFGEPFASRVAVAHGVLDGERVALDRAVDVHEGAELVLLPPFSGGASDATPDGRRSARPGRAQRSHVLLVVGSLLVPSLLALGGISDRTTLGVVVTVIAVGSLVDLHVALAATGVRSVLPGGLLLALGPLLTLLLVPDVAVEWLPGVIAVGVMATFLLALMSQRRQETALIVGATTLSGLLVGFGAVALVLLAEALQPARFVAVVALVAVTDVAVVVATGGRGRPRLAVATPAALAIAVPAGVVMQAVVGWAGTVVPVVGLALVAVVAAIGGARLRQVLRPRSRTIPSSGGLLIGTADSVLIGMPLMALWLQLLAAL